MHAVSHSNSCTHCIKKLNELGEVVEPADRGHLEKQYTISQYYQGRAIKASPGETCCDREEVCQDRWRYAMTERGMLRQKRYIVTERSCVTTAARGRRAHPQGLGIHGVVREVAVERVSRPPAGHDELRRHKATHTPSHTHPHKHTHAYSPSKPSSPLLNREESSRTRLVVDPLEHKKLILKISHTETRQRRHIFF